MKMYPVCDTSTYVCRLHLTIHISVNEYNFTPNTVDCA